MAYKAVVVRRSDDELVHWKYIKKIKTHGGKTRYVYDPNELKSDVKNAFDKITGESHNTEAKRYQAQANRLEGQSKEYLSKAEVMEDAKEQHEKLSKQTSSRNGGGASEHFAKLAEDDKTRESNFRKMSYKRAGEAAVAKYLSEQSMAKYEKTIAYKYKKAAKWLKSVLGID